MNQTLKLILFVAIIVLVAFPILVYLNVNPFASWGHTIIGAFASFNIGKIPLTITGLIGGLGTAIGAVGGLTYLYKKTKSTLQQTQTALASTTQKAESLVSSNTSLATEKTQINDALTKLSAEKQALSDQASQLKTQVTTMQQNYQSVDAQRTALQNQVLDMKSQAAKAQAQLDVLIPKIK
jgi:uncharacterized protein (DUF3084 family)